MSQNKESKILSRDEIRLLLSKAKETNEEEWKILSYLLATGKRGSQMSSAFGLTAKDIIRLCRKYEVTPHMLRQAYAVELQDLGVHASVIDMLLGHRPLETEKEE